MSNPEKLPIACFLKQYGWEATLGLLAQLAIDYGMEDRKQYDKWEELAERIAPLKNFVPGGEQCGD